MTKVLVLKNEQKKRALDLRLIRRVTLYLLKKLKQDSFELGFHFVEATRMAEVNETFLQHTGSTDVITFDYADAVTEALHGEIFICVDDAIAQAKEFKTTWQSELIRYVVHSILHLKGYDDLNASDRKKMKGEENRLVKTLEQSFAITKVGRTIPRRSV